MIRVKGYTFVYNPWKNDYEKREGIRTRIFAISDACNIINILPKEVSLDALHYKFVNDILVIMDDAGFSMDVNKFCWNA